MHDAPKAAKDAANSLNNRAVSLLECGKQEEALQLWEQALSVQPYHPESTYNRDLVLWRTAKINDDTLVREMERLRTAYSGDWLVEYLLAEVHLERDDCEAALKTLSGIQGAAAELEEVQAVRREALDRLPQSKRLQLTFDWRTEAIRSVCLSWDGRFILSGNYHNTLKLWEVATGRCLRTFEGHTQEVSSVCLSADDRFALSGSHDKTLKLWEVATGRCLRTFEGHTDMVYSVCLSADARIACSNSLNSILKLWEVATGHCLHTIEEHIEAESVSLSADGRFVLCGSSDETLKLWEVATGRCVRIFAGDIEPRGGYCESTDSQFTLSSESDDKTLKLWERNEQRYVSTFEEYTLVDSASLSADGQFALSPERQDKTLKLWDVATGRLLGIFPGEAERVQSACMSADGRFALSSRSERNTLKLWDVATGRCLRTFEGHTDSVSSVCLSADSRFALSGSWDKTQKLWEVATGRCLGTLEGHTDKVTSVSLSADGRFALSGSYDMTAKLWVLDWELEDRLPADWDEGARLYLENFLTLRTFGAVPLPEDREPTEEEITSFLTRRGIPTWTDEDFQNLLFILGTAGYGWLQPEGVRQKLEAMAANWQEPPLL